MGLIVRPLIPADIGERMRARSGKDYGLLVNTAGRFDGNPASRYGSAIRFSRV